MAKTQQSRVVQRTGLSVLQEVSMSRVSLVSSSRVSQQPASQQPEAEAPEQEAPVSSGSSAKTESSEQSAKAGEWVKATEHKQDSFTTQAKAEQEAPTSTHSAATTARRTAVSIPKKPNTSHGSSAISGRSASQTPTVTTSASVSRSTPPTSYPWLQTSGLGKEDQQVLSQSLQQKPEYTAALRSMVGHPQFAAQDDKTKLLLSAAVFANKGPQAQSLLSSQEFQNLTTEQKHQASRLLLTSASVQPSRLPDIFEKLDTLKREFGRQDPNSRIGRASLANTAADVLKTHPEVFQLLSSKDQLSAMQVMLAQLGSDGNRDTATQRDVLQAVQKLKADNPAVTGTIEKTLEGMRGLTPWKDIRVSQELTLLSQALFGKLKGIPAYLLGRVNMVGTCVAMNEGVSNKSAGIMEGFLAGGVGTWLSEATKWGSKAVRLGSAGGWAVTLGMVAFDQFKGYVSDRVNQLEAQQAEQLLRHNQVLR